MKFLKFKQFCENLTVSNTTGMGPTSFPESPGTLQGFSNQKTGSGDIPMSITNNKKRRKRKNLFKNLSI